MNNLVVIFFKCRWPTADFQELAGFHRQYGSALEGQSRASSSSLELTGYHRVDRGITYKQGFDTLGFEQSRMMNWRQWRLRSSCARRANLFQGSTSEISHKDRTLEDSGDTLERGLKNTSIHSRRQPARSVFSVVKLHRTMYGENNPR